MKHQALTDFERRVFREVLRIPLGETRTYAWIAARIGRPNAARAVGQVLKRNPWPLLIPCHRVIRSDGRAGGYAGEPDSSHKKALLEKEQRIVALLRRARHNQDKAKRFVKAHGGRTPHQTKRRTG